MNGMNHYVVDYVKSESLWLFKRILMYYIIISSVFCSYAHMIEVKVTCFIDMCVYSLVL